MSKNLGYTATNMARPFWIREMIIGDTLKKEGYSDKEIRKNLMKKIYSKLEVKMQKLKLHPEL